MIDYEQRIQIEGGNLGKRSYFTLFKRYKDDMTDEQYNTCLRTCWEKSEKPIISKKELIEFFKSANKKLLMTKEELETFNKLPEEVTIYRGLQTITSKTNGLSWTLNIKIARWFAERWDNKGKVIKAKINKEDIFAIFKDRKEKEVIINPKKIMKIQEV